MEVLGLFVFLYGLPLLVGLVTAIRGYFKDGVYCKRTNAALALLSFIWPLPLGLLILDGLRETP
jgi:hypothetical protein